MSSIRCPTCGASFDPSQSDSMPFCCERCRLADLGRWLNEVHTLPRWADPEEEESEQRWISEGPS